LKEHITEELYELINAFPVVFTGKLLVLYKNMLLMVQYGAIFQENSREIAVFC
jgi:hypothetical protein